MKKKILVIDDEERIRRIYEDFLTLEGFNVVLASNANEATRILIREKLDLILLDLKLPGIDGRTMYEVIREYDSEMKVIVSSVFSLDEQKRSIVGATDYHDKAQGIEILLVKINNALGDAKVEESRYN